MEKYVIQAERRKVFGKQVKAFRRTGKLPCVIYGKNIDVLPITVDFRETTRILNTATQSSLITIELEGESYTTLVQEKQLDYIRGEIIHIDFRSLSLTDKIRANVIIETHGTSPAVTDFNGVVVLNMNSLVVECLPHDLPEKFEVDISVLKNIGDNFYVKDIVTSDKIEIMEDPEAAILSMTGAEFIAEDEETDEELEDMEGMDEPEVIEKGKREDEDVE